MLSRRVGVMARVFAATLLVLLFVAQPANAQQIELSGTTTPLFVTPGGPAVSLFPDLILTEVNLVRIIRVFIDNHEILVAGDEFTALIGGSNFSSMILDGSVNVNGTVVSIFSSVGSRSQDQWNEAISNIIFQAAAGSGGRQFEISIIASDGSVNAMLSNALTRTINVMASNNNPPTGEVTIDGIRTQGETLTVNTDALIDADGLGTLNYQWLADDEAITDATANTYTLTQNEVGEIITVVVSYTDDGGTDESVPSTATEAITNVNEPPTAVIAVDPSLLITENGVTGVEGGVTITLDGSGSSDPDGDTLTYAWSQFSGLDIIDGETFSSSDISPSITIPNGFQAGDELVFLLVVTDPDGLNTNARVTITVTDNNEPTGVVSIDGTPTQGNTLTVNTNALADADGLPNPSAFTYQWLADGEVITDAISASYTLTQNEVGQIITVVVSYNDLGGTPENVTSTATTAVIDVNDDPTGGVSIDGTPTQGETLTVNTSALVDADGLGTFSYIWIRGNDDALQIDGATETTYTLTQDDVGRLISVIVSYTDLGGMPENVTSTTVGPVTNVNDDPTGVVTIDGTPTQGATLTVNTDALLDADGLDPSTFSYQWQANGSNISGANDTAYTLPRTRSDRLSPL